MKPTSTNPRSHSGFTLIELVTVIMIIGIMAVAVVPRLDMLRGFDEIGYRDKVRATLEYARKAAVAQRRGVRVSLAGNSLALDIETCHPEGTLVSTPPCPAPIALGTYPRALALPALDRACGGATNQICAPSGVTLGGPATLTFTPLGVPSAAATYTVTGPAPTLAAYPINVTAETGYVP